jgi:hypothetical protein
VRKNDPTGKSPGRCLDTSVQPLVKKYSDFQKCQISPILSPSRAHKRGASRSSRTLGAGCGGRGSAADERHGCGRRSRVVLTPRRWRSSRREIFPPVTVTKKPDHRGEREVSRKPLRREGRTASAEPVCSCALCFVYFARETAGAARTRLSLRPLTIRGRHVSSQNSRETRGEIAKLRPGPSSLPATNAKRLRKGVKRRSNPFPFHMRLHGLLRFARNDVLKSTHI